MAGLSEVVLNGAHEDFFYYSFQGFNKRHTLKFSIAIDIELEILLILMILNEII